MGFLPQRGLKFWITPLKIPSVSSNRTLNVMSFAHQFKRSILCFLDLILQYLRQVLSNKWNNNIATLTSSNPVNETWPQDIHCFYNSTPNARITRLNISMQNMSVRQVFVPQHLTHSFCGWCKISHTCLPGREMFEFLSVRMPKPHEIFA